MKKKTNAERFINCFNKVDYALKAKYNFNRSMGFSDLIRRTVALNYVVRKYEDELIDYGRLRNAIVHSSNNDIIIAEPHEEVVEKLEKIEKLINKPAIALDTVCHRDILSVSAENNYCSLLSLFYSPDLVFSDGSAKSVQSLLLLLTH